MYLGENIFILEEDIIAIIDIKSLLKAKVNKNFIEKYGIKLDINEDIKSYILVQDGSKIKTHGTKISSSSIKNKYKSKGMKYIDG